MLENEEAVARVIEIMEALGCTAGQSFLHDTGYLLLQSPRSYRLLTGPPHAAAYERAGACGAPWRMCRFKVSAARAFRENEGPEDPQLPSRCNVLGPAQTRIDERICFRQYFLQWPLSWISQLVKFESYSLHLLQLAEAGGTDLCSQYPLLALLASLRSPSELPIIARASPEVLLSKFRLETACPSAALKILSRLAPQDATPRVARLAREVFNSPRSLRKLYALPRPNRECFELLVGDLQTHVTDTLLQEVMEMGGRNGVSSLLAATLNMGHRMGKHNLPAFASVGHLYHISEELHARDEALKTGLFTTAITIPYRGVSQGPLLLEPITSAAQAIAEGRRQGVCIGSPFMLREMLEGNLAAYVMRAPERATVTVRRSPDSRWELDEIAMAHNAQAVQDVTRSLVIDWLNQTQSASVSVTKIRHRLLGASQHEVPEGCR